MSHRNDFDARSRICTDIDSSEDARRLAIWVRGHWRHASDIMFHWIGGALGIPKRVEEGNFVDENIRSMNVYQHTRDERDEHDEHDEHDVVQDNLTLAVNLVAQAGAVGQDFVGLLGQELKLALGDALRIIVLSKIYVYLVVLAWLGLSVCISWMVYDASAYGPWSALVFFLLQIMGLLGIHCLVRSLGESLSLPQTRAQLRTFLGGEHDKAEATA